MRGEIPQNQKIEKKKITFLIFTPRKRMKERSTLGEYSAINYFIIPAGENARNPTPQLPPANMRSSTGLAEGLGCRIFPLGWAQRGRGDRIMESNGVLSQQNRGIYFFSFTSSILTTFSYSEKRAILQPYFLILTTLPFNRIASFWTVPELNLNRYQAS
jgi:hypothetical protein